MHKAAGKLIILATLMATISACTGIGPGTVARDRFDYTSAISESWKSQMLLNIVKMRYGDSPVFLDVASVINQYSLEHELSAGATSELYNRAEPSFVGPFVRGTGRYTDRPTITYSPISGEKFARNLMTPLSISTVLHLIQSGYPIDTVFRFSVHSLNGIRNRFGGAARAHSADPEFYQVLEHLKRIQNANAIGMRIRKVDKETIVMTFAGKRNPAAQADSEAVRKILGLDPLGEEFEVVYDSVARNDREVAILTRSMLEVLIDLSSLIDVPPSHVADRRVNPSFKEEAGGAFVQPLIKVYSSSHKPGDSFVAVQYRDHWFYIDDRDLPSKGMFSFLMFAFTLTEKGTARDSAPIVTIPTN